MSHTPYICKCACERINKTILLFTFFLSFCNMMVADPVAPFPLQDNLGDGLYPKREARAVWLTTISGLDWPRSKATSFAGREQQKRELCYMLDQLKAININTVLLQTRVRASTIYPSKIEPWDVGLTSQYNMDPGYDPLQFAIDECHKRGMELHAWVVTIPAYKIAQTKQMGASGIHAKKASLIKKHNEQYYLDPGNPGTADYLVAICDEIVRNYDVDGIHFDYIRYPENASTFPDADTYKKYGNGQDKAQWRRNNITRVVRAIYQRVKSLKPWVRVSSSPVGKFRDLSRYSSKGWNCYNAVFQDAQGWLQQGIHDALYPMMYFKGNNFYPFAADWREQDNGRLVAPGLGIYFMAPEEKNWPLSDITNELYYTRSLGIGGQCYFRTKFLLDNVKGIYDFLHDSFYAFPSLTPAATWIDNVPPSVPQNFRIEILPNGMERLIWDPCTDNLGGGVRYNVYVCPTNAIDASKAENLVATALPEPSYTYNPEWLRLKGLCLLVRSMDRCGNESPHPSDVPSEVPSSVHRSDFFTAALTQSAPSALSASAVPSGTTSSSTAHPAKGTKSVEEVVRYYGCVQPDAQGNIPLPLPPRYIEFYAITDLQGRILATGRYNLSINVSRIPSGWYQVRTLEKNGSSRVVQKFWKQ